MRWLLMTAWALCMASTAFAQIVTDGTVGPQTTLSGPDMRIGVELGAMRGTNLFHSFDRFDIPSGQSATFTGPDNIQNLIGRVTGGRVSTIDGTLRSTVGQANVYLINPSGVVMGPNASVDVPAALNLSTADELRFSDGSRYSASDLGGSTLTMAAPESFGFLGRQPGNLTLEGTRLEVPEGQTLSLSGGDLTIRGQDEQSAQLTAPGGRLQLDAVGTAETQVSLLPPSPLTLDVPSEPIGDRPYLGRLEISQAQLDTSGEGGGRITLTAGNARLSDAQLITENRGATDASGGIEARVTELLQLDRSDLAADTVASGRSGTVRLLAGELRMEASHLSSESDNDDSWFFSPLHLSGATGGVVVHTREALIMDQGSTMRSITDSHGAAGPILLTVGSKLSIRRGSSISTSAWWTGDAGDIIINAVSAEFDGEGQEEGRSTGLSSYTSLFAEDFYTWYPEFHLSNSGRVILNVEDVLELHEAGIKTWSTGNAGDVIVNAGSARFVGAPYEWSTPESGGCGWTANAFTGLASYTSPACDDCGLVPTAGRVILNVEGLLEVLHGARISGDTADGNWPATPDAADLIISAGAARFDGEGFDVGCSEDLFTGVSSRANSDGGGNAGRVTLTVDGLLEVLNGARINSSTRAVGDAGEIIVSAGTARFDNFGNPDQVTGILSMAEDDSSGDAGTITLRVDGLLEVLDGAEISTSTWSAGDAGAVTVTKARDLVIRSSSIYPSGIRSAAGEDATGRVGTLTIHADTLTLGEGGRVSIQADQTLADAELERPDSSIKLDVNRLRLGSGRISAESTGNVPAAAIDITGQDLRLTQGGQITTEAIHADAGAITIGGGSLWLSDSQITTSVGATRDAVTDATGNGGDIVLRPKQLVLDGGFIQANTAAAEAKGGNIFLDTRALIASRGTIEIGGLAPREFAPDSGLNIIQSAAPGGEQGRITNTAVDLDIATVLTPVSIPSDPEELLADSCRRVNETNTSALIELGWGGVPSAPSAPAAVRFEARRLDRLLAP